MESIEILKQLQNQIEEVQQKCNIFDHSKEEIQQQTKTVTDYGTDIINNLSQYNIQHETKKRFTQEELYDLSVGDKTASMEQIIQKFEKYINTTGIMPNHPGFMAYVVGGGLPIAAFGEYLAALVNKFTTVRTFNPGAFQVEKCLFEWAFKLVGYPQNAGANFTTGGSQSNLYGILSGRDKYRIKGKDLEQTVIYTTSQTHGSNEKALLVAGLRECIVRLIDIDEKFKMKTDVLEQTIESDIKQGLKPFLVIVQAGGTNTGAIDPLQKVGVICKQYRLWMHTDAAYGGFFMLTNEGKNKLQGIELSDSITLDPHKSLFQPYGLGLILVKDQADLLRPFTRQASNSQVQQQDDFSQNNDSNHDLYAYMQDIVDLEQDYPNATDLSLELSRNFRSLKLWISLQFYGQDAFAAQLNQKLLLAKYVYYKLKQIDGVNVLNYPDLSAVCFRYEKGLASNEQISNFNFKVNQLINTDNQIYLSSTAIDGIFTLRISFLSFRNKKYYVDIFLDKFQKHISAIVAQQNQDFI